MDTSPFFNILFSLRQLSNRQLRSLSLHVQKRLEKDELNQAMETRTQRLDHCLFCNCPKIIRWGFSGDLQRYRCQKCGKTFNELTKTPFARLRAREKLLNYADCMVTGATLRAAAKTCEMALSTSFRWRHRLLTMPEVHKASQLGGIVEADETFFRESFKGKRRITSRKPRHHGRANKGEKIPLIPVLVLLDRYEQEADFVLENNTIDEIHPCMHKRLTKGSVLCTDGSLVYLAIAKEEAVLHKRILSDNPARTIEDGTFHIQTLNNYVSRLKGWIRRFHGVGTAYLSNYLAWWRFIAQHKAGKRQKWLDEALSF
ncbi:IS1595 family transposase [Photobacterium galatheae]|uniref:ISXO2-like transposase domain-containing protein n=2 Tax=Photobacterium galatheae TaxID=1654360 RepID=A0A066RGT8_9GAMM|nr:IS1595 family transposase [Photobacterium galatheae]KDM89635.1 hypothetical protein EA58_21500 [Photobacterium galatheae]